LNDIASGTAATASPRPPGGDLPPEEACSMIDDQKPTRRVLLDVTAELLPPEPAPPAFDEAAPLRETYARRLRPEDRELLAALCGSILELTCETTIFAQRIEHGGIDDELAAAAAELRYAASHLRHCGTLEGDALSRAEHKLADAAERIASAVDALAGELEAAIAAGPSA
jgi:hypothetical protein